MIISHKHKFIFVAVPRTGTHSVRFALRQHLGDEDLEQVNLFTRKRMPFPEIAQKQNGHITAQEIIPHIGEDIWNRYFKFGFVRNPWDRFISVCFFLYRRNTNFRNNPIVKIKEFIQTPQFSSHVLLQKQHSFLLDENNQPLVDFIGRFENIEDDFKHICLKIGLPYRPLEKFNPSNHRYFIDYFDEELYQAVSKIYEKDIELFNYTFSERPYELTNSL